MSTKVHKIRSFVAVFAAIVVLVVSCIYGVVSANAEDQPSPTPTEGASKADPAINATPGQESPSPSSSPATVKSAHKVDFTVAGDDIKAPSAQIIANDGKATRPSPDPVRSGYRFMGWFDDQIEYDFNTPVTEDMTLTAHWSKISTSWTLSPDHGPAFEESEVTLVPPTIFDFTQVSSGPTRSLAIGSDGNAYTWTDKTEPVKVNTPDGAPADFRFTQVSSGPTRSLAIGSDGNAYTWTDKTEPVKVNTPDGAPADFRFTQVSSGPTRSLAIGSDGNAYTWTDKNSSASEPGSLGVPTSVALPEDAGKSVETEITSVKFGSQNKGVTAKKQDDGTWTVLAPAQKAGTEDVVISYLLDGRELIEHCPFNFDLVKYAVTFDKADQSPDAKTTVDVIKNELVPRPENPVHEGWQFEGWFIDDAQGSVAYDFSQPVTKTVTVTAHWTSEKGAEPKQLAARNGQISSRDFDNSCFKYPGQIHTQHWKLDYCRGPEIAGNTVRLTPPDAAFRMASVSSSDTFGVGVIGNGNLYTWGSNESGQLGNGSIGGNQQIPTRVDTLPGVSFIKVVTGHNFAVGLTSDGQLYSWGDNTRGQLGIGTHDPSASSPVRVNLPSGAPAGFKWQWVEAGYDFVVACGGVPHPADQIDAYKYYDLYSWGSKDYGQLGLGNIGADVSNPTLVPLGSNSDGEQIHPTDERRYAVGDHHVIAITTPQGVYSWGKNASGQLGTGDYISKSVATKVASVTTIPLVAAAGGDHSALGFPDGNTFKGDVYTTGSNTHGELGIGTSVPNAVTFTRVKNPKPGFKVDFSVRIALGTNHMIVTEYGGNNGYASGSDAQGQIGNGSGVDQFTLVPVPTPFSSVSYARFYVGFDSSFAVATNGFTYAWGRNDNNQLGIDHDAGVTTQSTPKRTIFPAPGRITSVKFGGVAGTDYRLQSDDTWLVTVPEHDQGIVTVDVQWTLYGVDQSQQSVLNYTYVRNMVLPHAGGPGMISLFLVLGALTMSGSLAVRRHRQYSVR